MALPLKASDTAGIGPLTLFYAVRTFVQAKNIIFFFKNLTQTPIFLEKSSQKRKSAMNVYVSRVSLHAKTTALSRITRNQAVVCMAEIVEPA